MSYTIVAGDTTTSLAVPCKDEAGDAINLTGATVRLFYRIANAAVVMRSMVIEDATDGIASYRFAPGELTPGVLAGEVEITQPLSDTQTGDITSASKVVTNLDTSDLVVGMVVAGAGIVGGSKIATIDSPTQVTLDTNAAATTVGVSLTFTGSRRLTSVSTFSVTVRSRTYGAEADRPT